jgi:tRNA1Val (adenine37-N6)-methyltransferase
MSVFRFKQFAIIQEKSALKVGTDALLLGARVDAISRGNILDIGSGTGVISLMLAQRSQKAIIDAVELDELAAEESSMNFRNSSWADRLQIHHADFFTWKTEKTYQLIVSNPPFYIDGLKPEDERLAASKHAVFDFTEFLEKGASLLSPEGKVWFIYPSLHDHALMKSFQKVGLNLSIKISVYGKPGKLNRYIVALTKLSSEIVLEEILVKEDNGAYSEQYKQLTKDFHDREL